MKLQQLYEYQFPQIKKKRVSRLPNAYHRGSEEEAPHDYEKGFKPSPLRGRTQHLGTGWFSSAYVDPDKPQDVRKVSRPNYAYEIDGFYFYMLELSKFSDNGNVYFPRFGAITIYEKPDNDGRENTTNIVYSAQMERLENAKGLSLEQKKPIFKKMFGDKLDEAWQNGAVSSRHGVSDIISGVVEGYNVKDYITDSDLLKAAEFVENVAKKHSLDIDIHEGNVMVRRTPYGLQPVITDPLSFQGQYYG